MPLLRLDLSVCHVFDQHAYMRVFVGVLRWPSIHDQK